MAVKTKDELITDFSTIIGEDSRDEVIAFLEDLTDTMESVLDGEDWKAKYEENDADWRRRYKERFSNTSEEEVEEEHFDEEDEEEKKVKTYEELFEEEK